MAETLADVRAVIPASCYRRPVALGLLSVGRDVVLYGLVLLGVILSRSWWIDLPLTVLAGVLVGSMFILGHDAAHGALFDSPTLNAVVGRPLMLPSLHLYDGWVLGHNRVHHGFTTRQGRDFVWHPVTPAEWVELPRRRRLVHRLEWSWAGAGVYYLCEVWWRKMMRFSPPVRFARGVRRDRWLVVGCAASVSVAAVAVGWWRSGGPAGGLLMWAKLVAVPFLVFSQVIGWTVYVHHVGPDVRWCSGREWTPWRGQMESTTIVRLPAALDLFFHHIFVHVPHHVDACIPWYRLPAAAEAIETAFPGIVTDRPFRARDYLRATRSCKLFDFDAGRWVDYACQPAA